VGAILSERDFAEYRPLWQSPLSASFCGHSVHTPPPNTWGAALLLQLAMLANAGIPEADAVLFIEGMRIRHAAYQALNGCIGDPEIAGEKARDVLATWEKKSQTEKVSSMSIAGSDTSQVIVADEAGNVVVMLQSVSVPFGSGIYLRDTGVMMNNRLSGFNVRAGDVNCVAPEKRPANTLVPALVMRNGKPHMGTATPGGPGQTGSLAQFMARVFGRHETLADATAAPRWSITRYGDWLIEDSAQPALIEAVRAAFPEIKIAPWGAINAGSIAAIERTDDGWVGTSDTRRDAGIQAF
jgi:gamma-glutamyltranspeptidase/glutathione hydrolase